MPGVYLSYPFCSQKCTYCNFASRVSAVRERSRYDAALERELRHHTWEWVPETIYWGGGTPSLIALDRFWSLMSAIPGAPWREATIECAPGTIDSPRAAAWKRAGINRVSLGVQSFVADEVRRTGRKHTAGTVAGDVSVLREARLPNINIDLIAGLPGQTEESWNESLKWVQRLEPPHVSVYLFEIDEDSSLGREALLGGVRYGASLLPSDEATANFYEQAIERLGRLGLQRYEVSNFALPGFESCHNLKYWRLEPYAGFGLDAHSFDGASRSANTEELDVYLNRVESGQSPSEETLHSDIEEEHFFVGLRQSAGIEPTKKEWVRFQHAIQYGIDCGLLEQAGQTLRLTERGFLLSNEIFQEFVGTGI
ncbi:MAG: radical SAM family heme chaperone HemW [Bryobacteraceae bacterium]